MFWVINRRQAVAALAICGLVLTGGIGLSLAQHPPVPAAAQADNWGLSFPQKGQPPVGNVGAEKLKEQNAYFLGDTSQKRLYLTFDAGYENGCTASILDTLKKHKVPATFFVVGHYLESAPDLVKRMTAEGHLVGNHTYHHPDMSAIRDKDAFMKELQGVEEGYKKLTGQDMVKLYRPPQGKYSVHNLEMAKEAGYATFFWSLAYVDWYADRQPTRQQALDKLVGRIHPGAIVLLHSTSKTNAQVLDELLTQWEKMGYTFGKLTELCGA